MDIELLRKLLLSVYVEPSEPKCAVRFADNLLQHGGKHFAGLYEGSKRVTPLGAL